VNTGWKDRITVDSDTLLGQPCIKGTRISVELILNRVPNGWSTDDLLASYPHTTCEDI